MPSARPVMINALKRSFKMENYFSGFIATGTEKVRCGFGNGDCIFLDLGRKIFAAADSSERNPWASKELLIRYRELLASGIRMPGIDDLKKYIRQIYSDQDYRHKTTFSSVWIERDSEMVNLHIANGGDSMVIVIDKETGSVEYKTEADMKFAGRSLIEASFNKVPLAGKEYRVILATDGYSDLLNRIGGGNEDFLYEILCGTPVHEVAGRLLAELSSQESGLEYDDIGFVIFDPFHGIENSRTNIIIGGTTSGEEKKYAIRGRGELPDEWHDEFFWSRDPEGLKLAGIILN